MALTRGPPRPRKGGQILERGGAARTKIFALNLFARRRLRAGLWDARNVPDVEEPLRQEELIVLVAVLLKPPIQKLRRYSYY